MAKPTELSRAERKAKKRALENAIPDLPGDEGAEVEDSNKSEKKSKKRKRDGEAEDIAVNGEEEKDAKKAKKEKKEKKSKKSKVNDLEAELAEEVPQVEQKPNKKSKKAKKDKSAEEESMPESKGESVDVVMGEAEDEEAPKKSKKERKAERRAAELAAKAAAESGTKSKSKKSSESTNGAADINGNETIESAATEDKKAKKNNRNRDKKRKGESANGDAPTEGEEKNHRFIVFVGNLPFTATKDSIRKHFASVQPKSIRPMTEKSNPSKCKGSAFVEFEGYDHMKTCLKLFHHSNFDDGLSAPRKINVELTVGGGGNTKQRRDKIEEKNAKLNDERMRRMQEEEKAKIAKAIEGGKAGGVDESAIHPSRRRFVPGAQ